MDLTDILDNPLRVTAASLGAGLLIVYLGLHYRSWDQFRQALRHRKADPTGVDKPPITLDEPSWLTLGAAYTGLGFGLLGAASYTAIIAGFLVTMASHEIASRGIRRQAETMRATI